MTTKKYHFFMFSKKKNTTLFSANPNFDNFSILITPNKNIFGTDIYKNV